MRSIIFNEKIQERREESSSWRGIQGFHSISRELKLLRRPRAFVVCESGVSIFTLAQIWRRGVGAIGILVGDGSGVGHPAHEQNDATAVVPDEEQERMVHLEVLVAEWAYPLQAGGRSSRTVGAAFSDFQYCPTEIGKN